MNCLLLNFILTRSNSEPPGRQQRVAAMDKDRQIDTETQTYKNILW